MKKTDEEIEKLKEADVIISSLADLREVVKSVNKSEQFEMISFPFSVAKYAKREIISLRTQLNGLIEGLEVLDIRGEVYRTVLDNKIQQLIKTVKENK